MRSMLLLMSLALLAGCASFSSQEKLLEQAIANCADRPTEAAKQVCVDNEIAAQSALQEQKRKAAHEAAVARDRAEGLTEAYNVPDGYREIATDDGLRLPQD